MITFLEGLVVWFLIKFTSIERKEMVLTPPDHYITLHYPDVRRVEREPGGSIRVEQKPYWSTERTVGLKMKFTWAESSPVDATHLVQCTGDDSYGICTAGGSRSTDHGRTGAARPAKRMFLSPQESFNKCKTHLAKIAFILQGSPEKMLTLVQLMDRLEAEFGLGRTKLTENITRVCLSTHKCFVKIKIAVVPAGCRWYWKLDHSKITEKMVLRHFQDLLEWFPELASMGRKEMLTPPSPDDGLSPHTTAGGSTDGDDGVRPTKRMCMSPDSSNATRQERFNKCKTYLAMIAFVLQDTPEKMLTFDQLMDRLGELGESGRTRSLERNICRAILSSNPCFFKIPAKSEAQWKLDHSKITEKMVRRHFKGIQEWFPELTTVRKEIMTTPPLPHHLYSPESFNGSCEVKFSSSFSIDSILNKDSPSFWCYPLD